MFIVSKRNYMVRRADGLPYLIRKDYIGDIPEDVAESSLVRRAMMAGMIFSPPERGDRQLEEAGKAAEEKASENDIRPDAEVGASGAEAAADREAAGERSPGKRGAKSQR